ncbi:SRPBCC family protein [Actinocorallia sp. B10E7]|uniref:type II toxin-antitoxin system Rv0910 family toxin n=1 Tax=Actinocorallia sp. B10E7 TaxID=3153558 RepID=UPI00325E2A41
MGHIETSKHLAAPADRVWAAIAAPAAWGDWLTIHAGWLEEPPATLAVGARLVEKVVMLGMANKLEWTVETLEARSRVVIEGKGMAGVKSRFEFALAPEGEGTTVRIIAEFEGSMIVGALGKAVERDAAKNLAQSLDNLAKATA